MQHFDLLVVADRQDHQLRNRLGKAARAVACSRYTLGTMIHLWQDLFNDVLHESKSLHQWKGSGPCTGAQLYLESLGSAATPFVNSIAATVDNHRRNAETIIAELDGSFRSQTRGSPFHYRSHFKKDPKLNRWCRLIEESKGVTR